MAQALQREGLAREPPSRDPLPSRSASWHTEPREAQGWGAPREHPRRSQSMHPGGGGDTQQLSMQRLKHILAPAAPAHWSGAPPVRSQTWHPSVATRPEDLAAEKVRRGANRPATLYDPTCSAGAGNNSAASTRFDPPSCSAVLYMYSNMHHICAGDAAAVQSRCTRSGAGARGRGAGRREYDADRGATAQDAEVAALTYELGRVLQLPLTLAQPFTPARTRSRWQATYEREQGAPPSAQDTAASQVCTNVTPNPPSTITTRTRTLAGSDQAFQVYQRLVAQLGNAVDEWAAAADVEQGVQAALHVVQQVAVRAAIAGMIVVIRECLLPLAMWITDQARAEAAEVTASTAARASARAVTGALSSIKYEHEHSHTQLGMYATEHPIPLART